MIDLERLKKVIKEIAFIDVYDRSSFYEHHYKPLGRGKYEAYYVPCSFETIVCSLFGDCEIVGDGDGDVRYRYVNQSRDEVVEVLPVQDVAQHLLGLTNTQSGHLYDSIAVDYAYRQRFGYLAERIDDLEYLIRIHNTAAIDNKRVGETPEYLWLTEDDDDDKTKGFNITLDGDIFAHIPWQGEFKEDDDARN